MPTGSYSNIPKTFGAFALKIFVSSVVVKLSGITFHLWLQQLLTSFSMCNHNMQWIIIQKILTLGLLSKIRVIMFPERVWTILPDMMPSILVAEWAFLPLASFLARFQCR